MKRLIGLFGDTFKEDQVQRLQFDSVSLDVDYNNNVITIPNRSINNKINNTVDVEIENYLDTKYIPVYLISNLPGIDVKINNEIVYSSKNYQSSYEAINNGKTQNEIEIISSNIQEIQCDYEGQKLGALWREEALKRIEKYRKKDVLIVVENQNQEILNNVKIKLKMNNNEFNFGTATNLTNYSKTSTKIFNLILSENHNKWRTITQSGYLGADETYKFATSNNFRYKGHNLWWDYVCTTELNKLISSDNEKEITFEYIYNKYNNNEIDINEANKLIEELKQKFEELVYSHIKEEVLRYPNITEWDVINEPINFQFFKYYLYDKKLLIDNGFLNNTNKNNVKYTDNDDYYAFLARCFDLTREYNNNAKLILNDEKIKGNFESKQVGELINLITNINKKTNNINAIGIQYHVNNTYTTTVQSYYNQINYVLNKTGIKNAVISEYDNYVDSKLEKYTNNENKTRADYLRDSLIMAYSNQNIIEFIMWGYNGEHFCRDERKSYKETVYPWLNYSFEGTITEDAYSTRLYKGTYEATITLPNGKSQVVNFNVSDNSNNKVKVVFNSNPINIEIKQQPNRLTYYKGDNLDLTGGIINVIYDDGTIKEMDMNNQYFNISGFNGESLGNQTITLEYNDYKVSFDIDVKKNVEYEIKEATDVILEANKSLRVKYSNIYINDIFEKYNELLNELDSLNTGIKDNSISKINNIYKMQIDIAKEIVKQYNEKNINISNNELKIILQSNFDITDDYRVLYKLYVDNDTIENFKVQNVLDKVTARYNDNTDIDLSNVTYLIDDVKNIYNNLINTGSISDNYLNKLRVYKVCDVISNILEGDIKLKSIEESKKQQISYSTDVSKLTNQDIIATLMLVNDKSKITNNDRKNEYIFTENGEYIFEVDIRGYKYVYEAKIRNIDKVSPRIEGVENGKCYKQEIEINIVDQNLSEVKITLNEEEIEYKPNMKLTEEGFYTITAKDKAGNITSINVGIFSEHKEYQIKEETIQNIINNTKRIDFEQKLNLKTQYEIIRNDRNLEDDDIIATGDILKTSTGEKYTLIVTGDINKDGDVNIKDLIKMRKYLLERNNLDETEKLAADCNLDGDDINIKDFIRMRIIALTKVYK